MGDLLLTSLGGAVGAVLRWALASLNGRWPAGTLLANLLGCAALGAVVTAPLAPRLAVVLGVGLLGGLTTFSTFAVEAVRMDRRTGAAYVLLSVGAGVALAAAGAAVGHRL